MTSDEVRGKIPTADTLVRLLEPKAQVAISVYIKTDDVGLEPTKRRAQLKNAEKKIMEQLEKLRIPEDMSAKVQTHLRTLDNDEGVWQVGHKGLALFITPDFIEYFHLPNDIHDTIIVSRRFHLKPIIKAVAEEFDFYLLELSEKTAQVYKGNRYHLEKVVVPHMPDTLEEVVGVETDTKRLQFHTQTAAPRGGKVPAAFHGQSFPWVDDKHRYSKRFLQAVDKAVVDYLEDEKAPLIVAGPERVVTLYREVTRYPYLLAKALPANDKSLSLSQLHKKALRLVQADGITQTKSEIEALLKTGDAALFTDQIDEILRQAELGRVDRILVAQGKRKFGTFDPYSLTVKHSDQSTAHDLFDLACAVTLSKGGKAYVLPPEHMPERKDAIAVFRYRV